MTRVSLDKCPGRQQNNHFWKHPPQICSSIFKTFRDRKRRYILFDYFSHNSPADRAGDVFKPSKDAERFLVSIEKGLGSLGFKFFSGYVKTGTGLVLFSPLHLALSLNRKMEL